MPVGGDLGFSYLVVLVVPFVVLVIALVVRQKWRLSVARREEIERLLVLAAEESARAEHESASVYLAAPPAFISGPLEHQCAVCFSPTKTRCARCKAVRYCSGKCQIVHWRQGHKDDCRPFNPPHQPNDVGGVSNQKVFQQEGFEIHKNHFDPEGSRSSESVLELNCSQVDFPDNRNREDDCIADRLGTGSISDESERQDGSISSEDHCTYSDRLTRIKPSRSNHDVQNGLKTFTAWDADGTNECSISDPHILFPGFLGGAISSASKFDFHDDSTQPSFSNAEYPDIHNSQSSINSPFKCDSREFAVKLKGFDGMTVNLGSAHSTTLGSYTSNLAGSKLREPICTSPVMRSTLHPLLSKKKESCYSDSVVHLPSSAGRHSFQCADTRKVDSVHAASATYKNGFKTSVQKVVDQFRVSKPLRHCQSGIGSEIPSRYIKKGLFPYELFVKLYDSKKFELLQPCGLLNCGNSCYANAVLQCLACTPPLTSYLLHGLHSKACKWKEWCLTCEFESLMLKAKEGYSPLSPVMILSQIHKIKSHFGNGREEDAHEFLRCIIDTMQSACLKEAGVSASGSVEEETTLIGLTFGGYLLSKIKCLKCGGKSEKHERIMDLTIEIGEVKTLEEAIRRFTGTEILDGENKYQCSRCKSYERAKKKFRVLEAPNVLTIALKRFQPGEFGKLNKWIQFPEILNLAPFMSGTSDKSPIYRLYGVIVHLDTMNAAYSGHYVCYVKNAGNTWFEIDDSNVKAVDVRSVLAQRAYMLLYARCSPRAPRLIRNLTARDSKKLKSPSTKSRSHSIGLWDDSADPLSDRTGVEPVHPNHTNFHPVRGLIEDDSWSENTSIFSEECSCSTESSNRDYSSTDDHFDSIFGNFANDRISSWRYASDSESSSSSDSAASISPIDPTGKSSLRFLDSDRCRKFGGSKSCRGTKSSSVGWVNPFGNKKPSLLFRRSLRERTG